MVGNNDGSDQLIGALYQTVMGDHEWRDVLPRICEAFQASAGGIFVHDFSTGKGVLRHEFNVPSELQEAYNEKLSAQNPWLCTERCYHENTTSVGEEILPNRELLESIFYRDYLKPQNLFHRLCGVVARRGAETCYVSLLRSPQEGSFCEEDKSALCHLLPHMNRSLKLRKEIQRDRLERENLRELLNFLPIAYLLVDCFGRLHYHNLAAKRMFKRRDALISRGGYLAAASKGDTTKLKRLIAATALGQENQEDESIGTHLVISRGSDYLPLICVLFPVQGTELYNGEQGNRKVAILAKDLRDEGLYLHEDFTNAFRLTHAEARLVAILKQGHGLFDTAQQLGITKNTARTHMRHIYSKVGANRQADLARLLEKFNMF